MSFQFFAWVACILYALEVIIGRLMARHSIKNFWFLNFIWNLMILFLTIPPALYYQPLMPVAWGNLLIASVLYALSGIFYVLCLYLLDVSILSPLFHLRTAFSVILGALMLGEILSPLQYSMISIMVLCGVVVSLDDKLTLRSFFRWQIVAALIEMLLLALMAIYIKRAMHENSFWQVTLWLSILAQLLFFFTIPLFAAEVRSVSLRQLGFVFLLAVCGFVGGLAINRAYIENVSITAAIVSTPLSSILAMALAWKFPDLLENQPWRVYAIRFVATIIMCIAAVFLSPNS